MKGSFKKLVILLMIFAAFTSAFAAGRNNAGQARPLFNQDIAKFNADQAANGANANVSFAESRAVTQSDMFGSYSRTKQVYNGIVVEGGEKIQQSMIDGRTITTGYVVPFTANAKIPTVASVSEKEAVAQAAAHFGVDAVTSYKSEMRIYPVSSSEALLTYRIDMMVGFDRYMAWVDANGSGFVNGWFNSQSGTGTGVLGDSKSIDTTVKSGSTYQTISGATTGTSSNYPVAKTYTTNNGTSLPGTIATSTNNNNWTDGAVVDAHAYGQAVYDFYKTKFGRNSYNNAGATLIATVHYSNNYVNAYWNGTQMVYGDGDGVNALSLSGGLDVVAHELSHAVTEYTWNGNYSYESGALNEAFSDIMGTYAEKIIQPSMFDYKMGEDIWTPGTSGDALRYMNNPTQDGSSKDHYSSRYTGSSDNGGVHWNSGIANLAFYLLAEGGPHPRLGGASVTGVGIDTAAAIFYSGFTNGLTSTATFLNARNATYNVGLTYSQAIADSVSAAWAAVGVGSGTTPPPTGSTALTNGQAVTGLSGATSSETHFTIAVPSGASNLNIAISGGTGDCDLYVKFGSAPTTSSYDIRPYLSGNNESGSVASPSTGTYYIMLRGYSSYSGVSLVASFDTVTTPPPPPPGNVVVINQGVSGARRSKTYFSVALPSGATNLKFEMSGGSGDADLYVRIGSNPTTSTYGWRSWNSGNNELISLSSPSTGTYKIMVYGYSAYSGATLKVSYDN